MKLTVGLTSSMGMGQPDRWMDWQTVCSISYWPYNFGSRGWGRGI